MKKIMTALLLTMVFFGLMPFASAREDVEPIRYKTMDVENGSEETRPVLISADANMTQLKERIQERVELARERYVQAKERYQTVKQNYIQARERINQTKEAYNACKGETTEECDQIRTNAKTQSKEFLKNSADRVTAMLQKVKERISASEDLTDEEVAERVAEIDAKIAEIEEAQDTIGNLDNESTNAEIRAAVGKINQAWKRSQTVMKRQVGDLTNEKIGGIVVKSEKLSERLQNAIGKLEEQGEDVSELEDLMEDFNGKVESANENQEKAREQYRIAKTPGKTDEAMQTANRYMQEAHKQLQEAHSTLSQMLRQIKQTRQGQEALEEAESEE